jgi:hypothetical protein
MHTRARMLATSSILVVALLFAFALTATAQDKKGAAKVDKVALAEQAATVKMMDDLVAGQPAPTDFTFSWVNHLMKSRDGKAYIPFILSFDKGKPVPANASYFVRVVSKAAGGAELAKKLADYKDALEKAQNKAKLNPEDPDLQEAVEKLRASGPKVEYAFEDLKLAQAVTPMPNGTSRYAGALAVAAGDYDVYVLFKEPTNPKEKKAQPKAGLLKVPLSVPNLFTDDLALSTVFVTNQAEQLKAPPSQDDLNKYPYIFGNLKVTPMLDPLPKFGKKDELSIFFYIYNTGLDKTSGKPDVSVEYNFYRKADGAEKYFNKTNPQLMNATTLPPQFDVKAGHQLLGGQSIPLASFPEGDYRLEIKVTDKVTGKSKVDNAQFSVVPVAG